MTAGHSTAQLPDYILTNYVVERDLTGPQGGVISGAYDIAVTPDGSRMVVSSSGDNAAGCSTNTQGVIYIYDYNDATGVWALNDTIKECSYRNFGQTLAISDDGSTILIGHGVAGYQNNGRAWVYREVAGQWTLEFSPSDPDNNYGQALDLDSTGNLAIIVAPDQLGSYFTINRRDGGGTWNQELFEGQFGGFDTLAIAGECAIDGDWAAVAGVYSVNQTSDYHVRMYHFDGSTWSHTQDISPQDAFWGSEDNGTDIEIDGDRMIIGVGQCCGTPGFVRIYELNQSTNQWEQVFEDLGAASDTLGYDVDILGDRAVATRNYRNDAFYYERVNGTWQFAGVLDGTGAESGFSCAVMDRGFLVGGRITISTARATVEEYAAPNEICSFIDDFDGLSEIPTNLFALERPCGLQYIQNDQLVLERPAGCTDSNNVIQAYGDLIVGDFDLSIDWERFGTTPYFNGENAFPISLAIRPLDYSIEMAIELVEVDGLLSSCQPSTRFFKAWDRISGSSDCTASLFTTGTTIGSFRIARQGTSWAAYYKLPGDPDWTLFRAASLTDAPVVFTLSQFGSIPNFGVRLDNLALDVAGCSPCLADVTTQGAPIGDPNYGVPDGVVSAADLNYFVNAWVAGDLAIADVTTQGAPAGDPNYGVPDGVVSAADLNFYVNLWVAGCP